MSRMIPSSLIRKILSGSASSNARLRRSLACSANRFWSRSTSSPTAAATCSSSSGSSRSISSCTIAASGRPFPLDRRDRAARLGNRLARPAVDVDVPARRLGARVEQLGGRVAQQIADPLLHAADGLLGQDPADVRAREAALEEAGEEEERDADQRDQAIQPVTSERSPRTAGRRRSARRGTASQRRRAGRARAPAAPPGSNGATGPRGLRRRPAGTRPRIA